MSKVSRVWKGLRIRASVILFAKLATLMLALAFASDFMVSTTTYQAEVGSFFNVTNVLLATDKGFSRAAAGSEGAGTNCSSAIIFGSTPGIANTSITQGHWVFDVQVNSTSTAGSGNYFNVTFVLASNSYGPLCIKTPSPALDNQYIDCKFDVGNTLPSSPYTFKILIQ